MKLRKIHIPKIRDPVIIFDIVVTIIGIVMIGKGLYMIYPPLMYVTVGIILAFPGWPERGVK